jgi:hypothetical protein
MTAARTEDGMFPQAWLERLFARFQACYGNRMSVMYGDVPPADIKDAWRTGLTGVPVERIRIALINIIRIYPSWPPTLPEFLRECREEPTRPEHRPALLPPETRGNPIDPEVRLAIIASLERAAKGLKRRGTVDLREVCASTYNEVAGKVEKMPVER